MEANSAYQTCARAYSVEKGTWYFDQIGPNISAGILSNKCKGIVGVEDGPRLFIDGATGEENPCAALDISVDMKDNLIVLLGGSSTELHVNRLRQLKHVSINLVTQFRGNSEKCRSFRCGGYKVAFHGWPVRSCHCGMEQ